MPRLEPNMIEQFVAMTMKIVAEDGIDNYLPTLLLPTSRTVLVMEDIPDLDDHELMVREWLAERIEPDEPHLVAYRCGARIIKVVGMIDGSPVERQCPIDTR
jgi:hypothetical protein